MGGLILGVNTLYSFSCFLKLVGKGLKLRSNYLVPQVQIALLFRMYAHTQNQYIQRLKGRNSINVQYRVYRYIVTSIVFCDP